MLVDSASTAVEIVRLAQQALERGHAALAAGNSAEAIRWFDRACRLAPDDRTLKVPLAAACLGHDNARAEAVFAALARDDDLREAWLGLAAARRQLGDIQGAADALAQALARHAPDAGLLAPGPNLADDIVARAGAAGWCGLTGDGRLVIRSPGNAPVELRVDGRLCPTPALPLGWHTNREITVRAGDRPLLGSPIHIAAIRGVAGFVEATDGGLTGWAWHPGDPDTNPVLRVLPVTGRGSLTVTANDLSIGVQHQGPLARPRRFVVPPEALAGLRGPVRVVGRDGMDLLGSPLDPRWEQRAASAAASVIGALYPATPGRRRTIPAFAPPAVPVDIAPPTSAAGAIARMRGVDVVIPVYGKRDVTLACLDSVLATVQRPSRIVVVDDASDDPALHEALDRLAAGRRIQLLRMPRRGGFSATANAGIAACPGRDVVLLNSDTLVAAGWVERLRRAAYAAANIGTATPLSNHASILSYPGPQGSNPTPDLAETIRLDGLAARANPDLLVDIPVAVGFCMYLRRDCIDAVGLLRGDVFAQGYGEENDFCLRGRHLGWRHVAVPGVFVGHVGGASFGQAGLHLRARNERLLNRMHPGYPELIADHIRADPLADARRRIDLLRWRSAAGRRRESAILITHTAGGGVERQIAASAAVHGQAGRRVVVLRPEEAPGSAAPDGSAAIVVSDGVANRFPALRYAMPTDLPALLRLLRATHPGIVEVHHLLGHPAAVYDLIAQLGAPYDVHIHDYPWFCPRVSLVGVDRRYCGEPAPVRCEACIADAGRIIDEDIPVQALRDRSERFLGAARRVVAPSADVATRMRRHFPALRPEVLPHEDDTAVPDPPLPSICGSRVRVCVLGAIGVHKGYDVLLACARDAAERRLKLEFVVVGHTIDDARLLDTGRVFITGRYDQGEAVSLVRAQNASLGLLPSVWPETWCLGLTELWRAGLRVAAFDLGAPAERIRQTGRGFLLPLGLPPAAINNALVAAVGVTGHE